MAASLMPLPKQAFFGLVNGVLSPIVGGKVYTYEAGTNTPKATYTTAAGDVSNANPVILDSRGEASVWLGAGSYKIVLKDAADVTIWTQDGVESDRLFVSPASGGVPRLITDKLSDQVSVKDFGAIGNGATDDTAALQAAAICGAKRVWVPAGTYAMASTVFVPVGVMIECEPRAVTFKPKAGGSFTGGFLFQFNTTDGSTWTAPYPNMNSGGLRNAIFENSANLPAQRGIQAFAACVFEQLRFHNFRQAIKRAAGYYLDSFAMSHIICEQAQDNTEYQIECLGLGDGFIAEDLHFPYDTVNSRSQLGLRLRGTNGGVLTAGIGGDYLFEQVSALKIQGGHFERAQHIADASSVVYDATNFYPDTRIPLIGRSSWLSSGEQRNIIALRDSNFVRIEGLTMAWAGSDVQLDAATLLDVKDTYQKWTASGALHRSQLSGIKVESAAGTALAAFNDLSYLKSKRGRVGAFLLSENEHVTNPGSTSFPGVTATGAGLEAVTDQATQWEIATGTYYYTAQVLNDKTRLVGRNQTNAEYSIAVAGVDKMNRLVVDFSTRPRNCILRLYRGTSAGSYDSYVDIHNIGSAYFYDNGNKVNGVPWVARAAGAVDTINAFGSTLRFSGELLEMWANALPSVGTWTQGDYVHRVDSTVDGNSMRLKGHVRLASGAAHVLNTDWANERASTVSPAV